MAQKETSASIDTLLQKLDPVTAEVVQFIRQVILETDPDIGERIKWNSPSFYYLGDMKPFDPKEYKRDIVVMNLHRGNFLLIFPTGAIITDDSGILTGDYPDGRKIIKITGLTDAQEKAKPLQNILKNWLAQVEK